MTSASDDYLYAITRKSSMDKSQRIPFNKPFLTGNEQELIARIFDARRFSGNGPAAQWCESFFEKRYGFRRALLTTSCSDALEMAALLLDLKPGDEVILPSYTFPSTANAYVLRGAVLRFADCCYDHPNIDVNSVQKLVNAKTRAIVCVHYSGIACDMKALQKISDDAGAVLIEDAAQAIESTWDGKQLGTFGALATFSFHETKNVHCGEGGLLAINDEKYIARAEILREKGTNRAAFFRGEVDKYNWVDVGSSFLPNEITAAFLAAQLGELEKIQSTRISRWERYARNMKELESKYPVRLPVFKPGTSNNAHLFYLVCDSMETRTALIRHLEGDNIQAVFHYQSLHDSPFFRDKHRDGALPNADRFTACLVRLPLFNELSDADIDRVTQSVSRFFRDRYLKQ